MAPNGGRQLSAWQASTMAHSDTWQGLCDLV